MHRARSGVFEAMVVSLGLCAGGCTGDAPARDVLFDFRGASPGWSAGFADVSSAMAGEVGFVADHRALPAPLAGSGLYQAGLNVSDDLCMWFTGSRDGFRPGATYAVAFDVGIASSAGSGCDVGVAASTYVKVGVASYQPAAVELDGDLRMNIDKGTPAGDGVQAVTLGDLRNLLPGCPAVDGPWGERELGSEGREVAVQAGDDGVLWFYVLTDSAWEGAYEVFFTHLDAHVRRLSP